MAEARTARQRKEEDTLEKLLLAMTAFRDPSTTKARAERELTRDDKGHMRSLRRFERRDEAYQSADTALRRSYGRTVEVKGMIVSKDGEDVPVRYVQTALVVRKDLVPTDQKPVFTIDGKSIIFRVNSVSGVHVSGIGDSII